MENYLLTYIFVDCEASDNYVLTKTIEEMEASVDQLRNILTCDQRISVEKTIPIKLGTPFLLPKQNTPALITKDFDLFVEMIGSPPEEKYYHTKLTPGKIHAFLESDHEYFPEPLEHINGIYLTPFSVIENKILFGKIAGYDVIQSLGPNVIIRFLDNDGTSYYVKARFDQQSKNIYPPV